MLVKATYKDILKIALPVIIGSMAQAILNLIDTAFLGRVDQISLAAAAIGITFYLVFTLVCMGMSIGVQIIVARRTGEGKKDEVGYIFDQGQYLLFSFGLLLFVVMYFFGPFILSVSVKSREVYDLAKDFLSVRSFGVIFVCLNMVYRALYIGLSKTKILIYTTFTLAGVNIVLDYFLIFGHGPFPQMGIKGAALASVIAEFTAMMFFILYTRFYTSYKNYNIFTFKKPVFKDIGKIINLSYPTVFQNFVSIASWFLFFLIIEKTGEDQLAASNVIRSLLLLMMFPLWGFAATANTMTSNLIGQSHHGKIPSLLKRVYFLSMCWVLLLGILVFVKPDWLLHIITNESHLIDLARNPLYVLFLSMFIFVPGVLLLHALIGTGDTRFAFFIEVAGIFFYLLHTYLAASFFRLSLEYIWAAEFTYWGIITLLSFMRLKSRKWKDIVL